MESPYGLAASGRNWWKLLVSDLKKFDPMQDGNHLSPCSNDDCLFTYRSGNKQLLVAIVVDDLFITSNDSDLIDKLLAHLREKYTVSDDSDLKFYLGVAFTRNDDGSLTSNQSAYIQRCFLYHFVHRNFRTDVFFKSFILYHLH